jgi:sulfite reductase alpha subunit-like flavoprotein
MRMGEENRIVVLFGSQTGTAQEVAEDIAREAENDYGLRPVLCSMNDYATVPILFPKNIS